MKMIPEKAVMSTLSEICSKKARLVIGINSGTSMNSMDLAAVRIVSGGLSAKIRLAEYKEISFPRGLREHVLAVGQKGNAKEITQLNFLLGKVFADAIGKFMKDADIAPSGVDLIGSHGQTICHHPHKEKLFGHRIHSSMQVGEPSVIANQTGIITVGDFRAADIAAGGSGAPLVPYFDHMVFRSKNKNRGILNIGGIANLTILKKDAAIESVVAWDTGPGNMIMDWFVQKYFHRPCDKNGILARSGKISETAVNRLMAHEYLTHRIPKSTGREMFGEIYCENLVRKFQMSKRDWIATVTEFTARSIYDQYRRFIRPHVVLDEVIVSGGGAKNLFLMERLSLYFRNVKVFLSCDFGIPVEAKEAMLFALLANEAVLGRPANLPQVTGAKKKVVLGKICLP
jgi:anhydro-N-acetylmuramic acid kinase